jgi:uncharacterized protein YegJ (DUF2314 family)
MKKFFTIVASLILLWTSSLFNVGAAPDEPHKTFEARDVRNARNFYSVVFYYTPAPVVSNTQATAEQLVKRFLPGVPFTTEAKKFPPPFVRFQEEEAPLEYYPAPDASYFEYVRHSMTDKEIASFQKTQRATRLILSVPPDDVWKLSRKFTQLVLEFAETNKAFIWDSATRECFSRKGWKDSRLSNWPENGLPDVTSHITVHLYRPNDDSPYLRAITLGMEKFALPDVVIQQMTASDQRPAGNLINLVCQSFAENPIVQNSAKAKFLLDALQASPFRSNMVDSLDSKATREITLALSEAEPQRGDPHNLLIELDFRNGKGKTEDERRNDLLSKLWGSSDSIVGVTHTDAILAASKRARTKLQALRPAFEKGLPPGSRLLVKGPFARDDEGSEYMWVEVMQWPANGKIEGILQNDPFYIRKLKAGAKVRVNFAEVFDYILYHADGTQEGNETGKLMDKQGGPTKKK